MSRLWMALALIAASGCAAAPRPAVLSEADGVAKTAGAQAAAKHAPEAFAHAEKLRRDAEAAYRSDDREGAQILAERAIAAYHHALVLGRVAVARARVLHAGTALTEARGKLADVEAEQQRVAAQADALELRIQVMRDAAPIVPSQPTDPARDAARLRAARSLALDARLLCTAARLLGAQVPSLVAAENATDEVELRLRTAPKPAPIDPASRARALCLAALTEARRPANASSSFGRSDQLLAELSAMGGLSPTRDERGVVVTLRASAAGAERRQGDAAQLAALARVAQAHPAFPLAIVVHDEPPEPPAATSRARGEVVATALQTHGVSPQRIWVHAAGAAHPINDGVRAGGNDRNARVEIIFVDPGG